MAKASRAKTTGANIVVPQNRDEAAAGIRLVGDLNRQVSRIETRLNDAIAKLKEKAEQEASPLKEKVAETTKGLQIWAEANRTSLTGGDKTKTVDLGTGVVKWRLRPPSVTIRGVEAVLEKLKTLGLQRFIRTQEQPDKEAMLREADVAREVAGISIGSPGEDFIVEPFETTISGEVAA